MGESSRWARSARWALSARTYRRVLHVLLGAVILLPYLGAGWVLVLTAAGGTGTGAMIGLTVPVVLIAAGVTVLPGVRELLVAAARALLDADLPAEPAAARVPFPARIRAAGWLVVCAGLGAVAATAVLFAVPMTVALIATPFEPYPPLPTGTAAWWAPPLALVLVPVTLALLVAAGALQARLVPWFLGPDAGQRRAAELAEELAAARHRADRQAERTRLARELHDSVGHALTVTTMQAGVAAELLGTDPAFVRRALEAIAETGRAALDDLDHVLGLLREDDDAPEPVRDLESLGSLLDSARTAGLDLRSEVDSAAGVPAAVSREVYRLVQEGLTNALRHAGPGPVELRLCRTGSGLELRIANARGPVAPHARGGRGLAGARERAALLGGTLTAAADGDRWVLHAAFPAGRAAPPTDPAGPAGPTPARSGWADRTTGVATPARREDDSGQSG
ncbi:sensor histidine kinase [Pseudonocardia parietis]|uniref:histidine kinase n=1 Tax=Pseudonocardia parietis TaxID=570936 RepID=A0ABS4VZ71_9PSEU|nr:histidine kinase [Pseudonocardia parietis]MBP2369247.1 signal transduction histidine kinase [Pseudonocardia parietis]